MTIVDSIGQNSKYSGNVLIQLEVSTPYHVDNGIIFQYWLMTDNIYIFILYWHVINLSFQADFLSPRFLGLLMILESRLVKNSPDSIKENILLSLGDILKLMGSRFVTPARFKILAILRTAISLKNSSLVYLGLKAWDSFIHWYVIIL